MIRMMTESVGRRGIISEVRVLEGGRRRGAMTQTQFGALVADAVGLKAGAVVELKKQDGKRWEVQWKVQKEGTKEKEIKGPVSVDAKHVVPFPVVERAEDPARDINSIEIMPMRWFLRECWFNKLDKAKPKGLAGSHFADPALAECTEREVVVPPFRPGDDVYKHTQELSRSIKLVLDADHGYSGTFQPTGNKDIPHTGAEMGPQLMGLYAEKTTGERDPETGKLKVTGDVFIPLSAIVQDPATYCDRNKFPRFFDCSPNIANLKNGLAKPIARSKDKEADYSYGFKAYIAQLRTLTFKFAVVLFVVYILVAASYGLHAALLTAIPLAYILKTTWDKMKEDLKDLWTKQYPIYREYWRFEKDDAAARQFSYNFPSFPNHLSFFCVLRTVLANNFPGKLFGFNAQMSSYPLPPDITQENKGVGGDKQGDYRMQYAWFGLGIFHLAHLLAYYTPIGGSVVEQSKAAMLLVPPLIAEHGTQLLGDITDATVTFYEHYGIDYYVEQSVGMAMAVPVYGRRIIRVWTRKVLYSNIWRKNKGALELPDENDETYKEVMPELFAVCEEEYGFQHQDERVCKAMFKRTEDKHVENVEHFAFLALLVLLPALVLTPKEKRSPTFFIMLPVAFFAGFVLVPHEVRTSLMYFGDLGLGNVSSGY